MRILWLSANKLGYELLLEAQKIKNIDIIGIITLSENSSTKMYDPIDSLKSWYDFGYPVFEIERINEENLLIEGLKPDIIMMCGWRQMVDNKILQLPPKRVIGFHPTLLPYGRGPAPIINSILLGVERSGLTMFYVNDGTDTGDIIGQEEFTILEDDYALDVYNKIIDSGKVLIKKYLPLIAIGKNSCIPQNEKDAYVFPVRNLNDNKIDLENDNCDMIIKKIRAFSKPYDGAYIIKDNKKIVFWKAEIGEK